MYGQISAFLIYFAILITVGFASKKRHPSAEDYLIGKRKLNFWLTAFAAHASDASSWLFLGLPAMIFLSGLFNVWMAVGLVVFMFLNWQFIAPRVRVATEKYNSLTFSTFFESRFADTSGLIRIVTAMMLFIFYTIYISSGVVGLGILINAQLGIDYHFSIVLGLMLIIPYLFAGGYSTLARTDLFQALFLIFAIVIVPLIAFKPIGGWTGITNALAEKHLSLHLLPNWHPRTLLAIFYALTGWGLGYFGQPHIVTKFMGIKDVAEMPKAKYVGMAWQILSFSGAVLIGLEGVAYFSQGLCDPEKVFVLITDLLFHPFVAGLMLCAVLAATISTINSQVLVLASSLAEDIYKRMFRKTASSKEILWASRVFVLFVACMAYVIAAVRISTIYDLVFFAWSGLGASFGPLLIAALYAKRINKYGAFAGIAVGGATSAGWFALNAPMPPVLAGFIASFIAIFLVSKLTRKLHHHEVAHYD